MLENGAIRSAGVGPSDGGALGASLQPIYHVNARLIRLAIEHALTEPESPVSHPLARVGHALRSANDTALLEVSQCSFLLADAGFRDPARWEHGSKYLTGDLPHAEGRSPAQAKLVALARSTLLVAWHTVQSSPLDAELVLGASPECAAIVGSLTLPQIEELAERNADWIRPRWDQQLERWRLLVNLARAPRQAPGAVARCALSLFRGDLAAPSPEVSGH
jgi:hypothetical protein